MSTMGVWCFVLSEVLSGYKAAQEYRAVYLDSLCGEIDPMILPKGIQSRTWGGPVESSAVSVLISIHIP